MNPLKPFFINRLRRTLPDEVWLKVLGGCDAPSLANVSACSRQMRKLGRHPSYWRDLVHQLVNGECGSGKKVEVTDDKQWHLIYASAATAIRDLPVRQNIASSGKMLQMLDMFRAQEENLACEALGVSSIDYAVPSHVSWHGLLLSVPLELS